MFYMPNIPQKILHYHIMNFKLKFNSIVLQLLLQIYCSVTSTAKEVHLFQYDASVSFPAGNQLDSGPISKILCDFPRRGGNGRTAAKNEVETDPKTEMLPRKKNNNNNNSNNNRRRRRRRITIVGGKKRGKRERKETTKPREKLRRREEEREGKEGRLKR